MSRSNSSSSQHFLTLPSGVLGPSYGGTSPIRTGHRSKNSYTQRQRRKDLELDNKAGTAASVLSLFRCTYCISSVQPASPFCLKMLMPAASKQCVVFFLFGLHKEQFPKHELLVLLVILKCCMHEIQWCYQTAICAGRQHVFVLR